VHGAGNRRALLLAAHEPTIDPRIDWMAEGLSADFEVCELGTYGGSSNGSGPSFERLSDRRTRVRVGRHRHDWDVIPDIAKMGTGGFTGLNHLMLLHVLAELPAKVLERSIGAVDATDQDLFRFRWATRHFLHTNAALLQAARLIGGFDVVVAADLDTLPAALVLAEEWGATVLYDAHEFWPRAFMEYRNWEVEFWSAFERNLAPRAHLRVTVSPQLANLMSKEYGCEFLSVPNCASRVSVPAVDIDAALHRLSTRDIVVFIYLGSFTPGRGLEDLIQAWGGVSKQARLVLQGPDDPFKTEMIELARRQHLLDNGIAFPQPVETSELVSAARQADIGIIPYAASSVNNRYCSPNKLSQYMAAGLPIVCCNQLEFVKSVVVNNGIGVAVDFRDHEAVSDVVNNLTLSRDKIVEMSSRSHRFFHTNFNWEMVSRDMYAGLGSALHAMAVPTGTGPDFSWIEHGHEMRKLTQEIGDGASLFGDAEIKRLNAIYPAEIKRLNKVYTEEIERLNKVYTAEIKHLNSIYSSEITRLNNVIGLARIVLEPTRIALRLLRRVKRLMTMKLV
jgi:glycosyltransferase involved in cell wall biosynthesis